MLADLISFCFKFKCKNIGGKYIYVISYYYHFRDTQNAKP